jgi:hypothetical protein
MFLLRACIVVCLVVAISGFPQAADVDVGAERDDGELLFNVESQNVEIQHVESQNMP